MTAHPPALDFDLPTPRDLLRPLFRYRYIVVLTFTAGLALTVALVASAPKVYDAEMKILVNRERLDPIMTSDTQAPPAVAPVDVSDTELNSEVELLQSRDLLEQVVLATRFHHTEKGGAAGVATSRPSPAMLAQAVRSLRGNLTVQPLKRTTLIRVTYRSRDPQLAARTLEQLATLYLEKHLALRRPEGAHRFFADQASRLQQELHAAEAQLREFSEREEVVSAAAEKDSTLQKLSEFEADLQQTNALIYEASRRLGSIDSAMASTPDRQVTQIRNAGNVELVRTLRSRILELEIKRSEMLQRFTPRYPPVMRLEEEMNQLRDAVTAAERAPLRDETTDQNPTYQWLRNEAARVRTERDALIGRAAAMRTTIAAYRERARRLDAKSIEQQELLRSVKTAEESYLVYQRRQEEARISDALDRTRIANVAVAEPPSVPQAPVASPRGMLLLGGGVLAFASSISLAYLLHVLNPYFRTSHEVSHVLDIPVLASLPAAAD